MMGSILVRAVFAALLGLWGVVPSAWSQPAGAGPACTPAASCSDHAVRARPGADGKGCECTCRNHWTGKDCSICPPGFSGRDCDRCSPGGVLPTCRQCSPATDCSNRGRATASADGLMCQCQCENQWSGPKCSVCPPQYAGADCDRCAPGLVNYPVCTKAAPTPEQRRSGCIATCQAAKCAGGALVAVRDGETCACSGCPVSRRVCGIAADGSKTPCATPTDRCLDLKGTPQCVVRNREGMMSYQRCGEC